MNFRFKLLIAIVGCTLIIFCHSYAFFSTEWVLVPLRGLIIDAATKKPIKDVCVTINDKEMHIKSDNNGRFIISDVPIKRDVGYLWLHSSHEKVPLLLSFKHIGYKSYTTTKSFLACGRTMGKFCPVDIGVIELEEIRPK